MGVVNMAKRGEGVYYTVGNPFDNPAFADWAAMAELPAARILEPFAGVNSLIDTLADMRLCNQWNSFDIRPEAYGVERRDTLADFPKGYSVCITNPPWLAKNSATARRLPFPDTRHDDLYKFALERCLANCPWVAALVPESFIRAGLFRSRLMHFVSLTGRMFSDTQHPVGLALFGPDKAPDVTIWKDRKKTGLLSSLEQARPHSAAPLVAIRFNDPGGNVGLIALDNTVEPSIRFCDVSELADYEVKPTNRHITKLTVEGKIRIDEWNACLNLFRQSTSDVLMTCYKGLRKDGWYRRRLDWKTARGIVNYVQAARL